MFEETDKKVALLISIIAIILTSIAGGTYYYFSSRPNKEAAQNNAELDSGEIKENENGEPKNIGVNETQDYGLKCNVSTKIAIFYAALIFSLICSLGYLFLMHKFSNNFDLCQMFFPSKSKKKDNTKKKSALIDDNKIIQDSEEFDNDEVLIINKDDSPADNETKYGLMVITVLLLVFIFLSCLTSFFPLFFGLWLFFTNDISPLDLLWFYEKQILRKSFCSWHAISYLITIPILALGLFLISKTKKRKFLDNNAMPPISLDKK